MRRMLTAALAVAGLVVANASAADFPDRPVEIIVPWAAGGGTDTVVRIFASGFEQELGVPVNVVNRPGGNGVAGHTAIATAAPDGYTLGAASPEIAFYETLGTADLSPEDLDLFSRLAIIPAGVTVRSDAPYATLEELLSAIRTEPERSLSGSGTGVGGSWHIALGGLLKEAGIDPNRVLWVPSQGGAPALQDVAAGGVTMFTGSPVEAQALLQDGRVKVLALMAAERSEGFTDVPTTSEQGFDWDYANWFALVAPNGIPEDRRAMLFEAAKRAHARPEVQSLLKERGIMPVWDEPGAFDAVLTDFVVKGKDVLQALGVARN